eukprot:TRINITY_DN3096_c0_g1_i2.p1 TRINITY_DN3096_c0_g1~~TRINITY_DN3096_c0_g1_i2.p1  ORF type:complete len:369 (+),score=44.03 TRINITY_DN3096_c0_g1_i2:230-1336(+)
MESFCEPSLKRKAGSVPSQDVRLLDFAQLSSQVPAKGEINFKLDTVIPAIRAGEATLNDGKLRSFAVQNSAVQNSVVDSGTELSQNSIAISPSASRFSLLLPPGSHSFVPGATGQPSSTFKRRSGPSRLGASVAWLAKHAGSLASKKAAVIQKEVPVMQEVEECGTVSSLGQSLATVEDSCQPSFRKGVNAEEDNGSSFLASCEPIPMDTSAIPVRASSRLPLDVATNRSRETPRNWAAALSSPISPAGSSPHHQTAESTEDTFEESISGKKRRLSPPLISIPSRSSQLLQQQLRQRDAVSPQDMLRAMASIGLVTPVASDSTQGLISRNGSISPRWPSISCHLSHRNSWSPVESGLSLSPLRRMEAC